jgi:co-chaperonin GroES (HSP10)
MNTLILPKHVAERRIKQVEKEKKEKNIPEASKLPKPTGWRLLVLPHRGQGKTKGGVLLSDKTVEETQIATNVGLVLAMGPDAYNDKERFPNGAWCKKNDWVIFARYAGSRLNIEGGELRILNDDEILGTTDDPESILSPITH